MEGVAEGAGKAGQMKDVFWILQEEREETGLLRRPCPLL